MIVSASYRTDIPAYYGDWFRARLAAGYADVRNPYGGKPYRVSLRREDVSGFVFWTRNPAPFHQGLEEARALSAPIVLQMTITGYPRALEPGVLDLGAATDAFLRLADLLGPEALVWRYDPVLLSAATPADFHLTNVARIAAVLAGAADECVFSFAQIYAKSKRNLAAADIAYADPEPAAKGLMLAALGAVVAEHGFRPTVCAQPDLVGDGVAPARCIDADRLSRLAGKPIQVKTKGARPGCLCAAARDIGGYDLCPQGCAYCYANRSRDAARAGLAAHDATATRL